MLPNPALIIRYQTAHPETLVVGVAQPAAKSEPLAAAVGAANPIERPAFMHMDVIGWGLYGMVALLLSIALAWPLFAGLRARRQMA